MFYPKHKLILQRQDCAAVVHAYVAEQVLQVVVRGTLPLVLRKFLHVTVKAEVQTSQLLLHLAHVFQLLKGAHLT